MANHSHQQTDESPSRHDLLAVKPKTTSTNQVVFTILKNYNCILLLLRNLTGTRNTRSSTNIRYNEYSERRQN